MTSEFILLRTVLPHVPLDSSAVDLDEIPDFLIPLPVSHIPASCFHPMPIAAALASQLVQLLRLTSDRCVSADGVSLSLYDYYFLFHPSFKLGVISMQRLHLIPTHRTPFSVSS